MKKLLKSSIAWIIVQPLILCAIPTNPTVVAGGATYTGTNSTNLGVNLLSEVNVLEWDNYSIANGETLTYSRNGSAGAYYVWNKVNGTEISQIDGALIANGNGNIFLFNQNGVVVGANGCVLTNSFVATTLDKVGEFTPTSNMRFKGLGSTATITINGTINALSGDVTIIGYKIINTGTLTASNTVSMAAGTDVLLQPSTNQKVFINAAGASGTGTGIEFSGAVNGKSAILIADGNAYTLAINHSGVINATACTSSEGRVMLIADPKTNNKGALTMSGSIGRNSSAGDGPSVTIAGHTVALTGSASINMSGANGGGNVTIGDQSTYNTDNIHIASGTSITTNANTTGNGGNVTMWADDSIVQIGPITSKGAGTGNGGNVSISSPGYLGYNATTDLRGGSSGSAGTLTLTTSTTNVGGSANYGSYFAPTSYTSGSITSTQTTSGLQNTLAYSNVSIVADGTNATGNMTVGANLTWSSGRTLSMNADNLLTINNDITMTGTTSSGTTILSLTAPTVNIGTSTKSHTTSRGVALTSGDIVTAASTALNLYGGAADNAFAKLNTLSGTNTITFGTNMNIVGGDATGANAEVKGTTVNINGITSGVGDLLLQADDCTSAFIDGRTVYVGQTVLFDDLEMIGGQCSSGNDAYIGSLTGASSIDIDLLGDLSMTGGSSGGSNHARIISSGGTSVAINIDANSIYINGGTGGSGNTAHIASLGSLGSVNMTAGQDLVLSGGGSSPTAASAYIEGTTVNFVAGRDVTFNGGSGTLNRVYIYGYSGVNGTAARNLALNGGSASQAYAEIKAMSGSINLNSSSDASTFSFTAGSSGAVNAAARLYMTGNGNINIGTTNAPDYVVFTGGSGGVDVYAQALIEGNGNITVFADEDIVLRGGGTGTYTHAGLKVVGNGNFNITAGRDLLMSTGTSTSSDVFFHALNGTITAVIGRDVVMSGSCEIPNDAYIKSDSTSGAITLDVARNLTQNGLSYIDVSGANQILTLNVTGIHTINDCAYINGGTPAVAPLTYPGNNYYSYAFLYELFYKLHYFTNYDWYLLHISNFWDKMMRTSP